MCVNKSSSGEINTTFEEMRTARSSRLSTNSHEAVYNITTKLIDGTTTSKKGLRL